MSLYAYAGSNPVGRRDPSGLVYDPFEDVDDVIAGMWAERAEAAQGVYDAFGGMFQAAAKMALQATMEGLVVSLVPGGALLVGAYHALNGAIDIYDNGLGWMNALELAGGGGMVAGALGRGMGAFNASRASVRMQRAGVSLPVLQRYCFVAGTLVLMEDGTFRSMESLRPADDVFSIHDPWAAAEPAGTIVPDQWFIIHLEMEDAGCETVYISLLRPVKWLSDAMGSEEPMQGGMQPYEEAPQEGSARLAAIAVRMAGAAVALSMPELGLQGPCQVVGVEPCPTHLAGPATGIVTGTIARPAPEIIELHLDSVPEPIGTTASHPFWSLDRRGWVEAGDLATGETLATLNGSARVTKVELQRTAQTVYNATFSACMAPMTSSTSSNGS